jgi:glycosyltransferase involved in cell wall biosynthesis
MCREELVRVIVVHNRYRQSSPSGENIVVEDELALLRSAGLDVEAISPTSDEISAYTRGQLAGLTVRPSYSRSVIRDLEQRIQSHRPDIIHVHNVYPLISPAVIRVAKRRGVRVVHSVHNYRLTCANGTHFRDGSVCTDCLDRRIRWPAAKHSCYRGSLSQTTAMLPSMALHRSTWGMVDRFFVLHDFARMYLEAIGIQPDRISLKANAVPDLGPVTGPGSDGFIYAGRLEVAKGVPLLLDAWARSGLGEESRLTIVGDGTLRNYVEQRSRRLRNVDYVGRTTRAEVLNLVDSAAAVVVPSMWFEGSPLLIAEGASRGRPAVVTRMGGLPDLVGNDRGWIADPTPSSLANVLVGAHRVSDEGRQRMALACRRHYELTSSPDVVLDRLLELYESVLAADSASAPRSLSQIGDCQIRGAPGLGLTR